MTILSGLAVQAALQLLALFYAVWSTKAGKIAIAVVAVAAVLWLSADHYLEREYQRGVAETEAAQEAAKRKAVEQARREGAAREEEVDRASAAEQAALRELEARKLKVRNETETGDRVLLSADDGWLQSKR